MNDSITVTCPECNHRFPLGEAVLTSVREGISRELQGGILKRETEIKAREQAFRDQQSALKRQEAELQDKIEAGVEDGVAKRVADIRAKAEEKAAKKAAEEQALVLKALEQERDENVAALKKARQEQLNLLAEKRALQGAKEKIEIEAQRKLNEDREKLREDLQKRADEQNRLKIAEKEKVISELHVKLQEAQRKAEQGSMQTQGEVLELDFEQRLRHTFPLDIISPVSTGARGADISQDVMSPTGRAFGRILFEAKRTKAWKDEWISKLRNDMREGRADIGVIVTETLPRDFDCFGQIEGVWVTDFASAIPLAHVLRALLHEVGIVRGHREGAREKAELLYNYLTGNEFRYRVQLLMESVRAMHLELQKERAYLTNKWNKREKQINLVVENMAGMVGDVQALSGGAIESIPLLDEPDETSDELESDKDAA